MCCKISISCEQRRLLIPDLRVQAHQNIKIPQLQTHKLSKSRVHLGKTPPTPHAWTEILMLSKILMHYTTFGLRLILACAFLAVACVSGVMAPSPLRSEDMRRHIYGLRTYVPKLTFYASRILTVHTNTSKPLS